MGGGGLVMGGLVGEHFCFCFGAPVYGTEGLLGTLSEVVVDAEGSRMLGLVARSGLIVRRQIRLPVDAVVTATESEIRVDWSARRDACRPGARAGVAGQEPLARFIPDALRVESLHGLVGHVRQVLVAAGTRQVVEYVVESGLFTRQSRRLPADWVRTVTPGALRVDVMPSALAQLPLHRTDLEVRADIFDAWFFDEITRPVFLGAPLEVQVRQGSVYLKGYAGSRRCRTRLEERARAVPGVREVCSAMVADDELVPEVERAMREDPRTWGLRLQVGGELGMISLEGRVPSAETSRAAGEVAAGVPRVRGVINRLRVDRGGDAPVSLHRVPASLGRNGANSYFRDPSAPHPGGGKV